MLIYSVWQRPTRWRRCGRRGCNWARAAATPTGRTNNGDAPSQWAREARPLATGHALNRIARQPLAQDSGDIGRIFAYFRRRNRAPTDRTPQTGPRARQTRRREAGGHTRQRREANGAQTNAARTGGTRSARRAPIFGIGGAEIGEPHNNRAQNGARNGHDDGARDGADFAHGGRIGHEVSRDDDDERTRRRIERAGARLRRASGAGRSDKEGELGHDYDRLAPRQR